MFEWLKLLRRRSRNTNKSTPSKQHRSSKPETERLSSDLDKNKKTVSEILDRADDLVVREFYIGSRNPVPAFLVYFDSLVDHILLQRDVIDTLMKVELAPPGGMTIQWLKEQKIPAGKVFEKELWVEVGDDITRGFTALFVEGQESALLMNFMEDTGRPVSQPLNETVTRGPSDAFNEDLRTNMGLIRKRLPTSRLAVETFEIGEIGKLNVNLVYLKGYVMPGLVDEVTQRLKRIKIDLSTGSGPIEELIQDNPYSPFSGIDTTERPDRVVSALRDGRVALIFDNTPFAPIMPSPLNVQMQSPDDYYNRYWYSSMIRLLRWFSLLIALLLPSFYIAVTTFHHELIPTTLLISIVASREGVPFPGFLEALIMEITFEILREAGVRLPKAFGQTISIVGAVVIGQAAVSASLVSPAMVVVVSLTAIASYTIPSLALNTTIRMLRFPLMIAAAFMGLFGLMIAFSFLTFHMCSIRTFGVPYLSPIAPLSLSDLKDTYVRLPMWKMNLRPRLTGYVEPQRMHSDLKPGPPAPRNGGGPRREGRRN